MTGRTRELIGELTIFVAVLVLAFCGWAVVYGAGCLAMRLWGAP